MWKKSIIFLTIFLIVIICLVAFNDENYVSISSSNTAQYDKYNKNEYIGYLIIPNIDMNLGFYDYDNPLNDVEKNIEFINTNVADTYLIAAHSGIGKKAYFNDLAKLKINDDIYLELYNKKMHYKVIDITRTLKNGEIYINNQKGFLYLTTCDQTIKGYQLTIIASIY